MFTKREKVHLLISILFLTFVFGFDDGSKVFIFDNWIFNLISIFFFLIISILIREVVVKFFSKRHDAISEYEIWRIKRVWFGNIGKLSRSFPLGILMALFITLGSKGRLFFSAIGIHNLSENKSARLGRKQLNLNYLEESQIVSTGILAHIFLGVIGVIIGNYFGINTLKFVNINFFMALFNMIPLSNLDGTKIFFGSLFTYVFLLVFIILLFLLIHFTVFWGILLAFVIAVLATLVYFFVSSYGR